MTTSWATAAVLQPRATRSAEPPGRACGSGGGPGAAILRESPLTTAQLGDNAPSTASTDMCLPRDFWSVQPPGYKGKIDFLILTSIFANMKTGQG